MRRLALVLACASLAATPAHAAFFPGDQVDGPSPDIERLGGLDVADDGGGAVTYLKREGGESHAFVARMENGAWEPPERLDEGVAGASTHTDVARIDDGRILAVWVKEGSLWARVRPAGAISWAPPELLWSGGVSSVSADMSIHGVGYVGFRVGGDVRAMRLSRADDTWAQVDGPIDVEPGQDAGLGTGPQMVAAQDGTGLVVWEEQGSDGRRRVWARRVIRTALSQNPREASVSSFEGRPGLDAAAPSAGFEDDANYGVVAFEQTFQDGGALRKRVLARRIVGVELDPPVAVDGLDWTAMESAELPRVGINARGETLIGLSHPPGHTAIAADFDDRFRPRGIFPLEATPSARAAFTVSGVSDEGDAAVAWQEDPGSGGVPTIRGRFFRRPDPANPSLVRPEPEAALSTADNGPALAELGIDAAADRVGDVAFAFLQGPPEGRRVMVATYDRPARATWGRTDTAWKTDPRYRFAWSPVVDLWGTTSYRVELNGIPVGISTTRTFKPTVDLPDGRHRWRVVTVDGRGQQAIGPSRPLNLDAQPPVAILTVKGTPRRRRKTRFTATIRDAGSGVSRATLSFGDGSRPVALRLRRKRRRPVRAGAAHSYRRSGSFTARLTVRDRVGHKGSFRLPVRVR